MIGLGNGQDSRVYTGYTATVQALGLLAEQLTGRRDGDDWGALPGVVTQLSPRAATSPGGGCISATG